MPGRSVRSTSRTLLARYVTITSPMNTALHFSDLRIYAADSGRPGWAYPEMGGPARASEREEPHSAAAPEPIQATVALVALTAANLHPHAPSAERG